MMCWPHDGLGKSIVDDHRRLPCRSRMPRIPTPPTTTSASDHDAETRQQPGADLHVREVHAARSGIRPSWLLSAIVCVHEGHVGAGHQALDVDQDQHPLVDGAEAGDVLGVERGRELRRRLDLLAGERQHVGHAVDHDADHPLADVEDDDDGELVVVRAADAELDPQVDDGDDDAAQVDDALDEGRGVGDGGDRIVAADLLDLEDVDPVLLVAEAEGEVLALAAGVGGGRCAAGA